MSKIPELAQANGETTEAFITRIVEGAPSIHKAAAGIDVHPGAIRYWMRRFGLQASGRRVMHVEKVKPDA